MGDASGPQPYAASGGPAAVQINFVGGGRRDYIVDYWSAGNGRSGVSRCTSLGPNELALSGRLYGGDLTNPTESPINEVAVAEGYLEAVDIDLMFS